MTGAVDACCDGDEPDAEEQGDRSGGEDGESDEGVRLGGASAVPMDSPGHETEDEGRGVCPNDVRYAALHQRKSQVQPGEQHGDGGDHAKAERRHLEELPDARHRQLRRSIPGNVSINGRPVGELVHEMASASRPASFCPL